MITREEYELLKHYHATGYKWIAREKNGLVYAHKYKPFKDDPFWLANGLAYTIVSTPTGNIFKSITWEDENPTEIDDLIRDYESHQVITGGNNLNKSELIKEIEEILDDIGVSDYQLGEYDCLRNHEDTSDILDKAWLDGFIVSEDEPLYYALIKGHELSSNEFKYWSCNAYNSGDLLIGSKRPKDSCINRMTKNNWNKLGISSSNADFVVE